MQGLAPRRSPVVALSIITWNVEWATPRSPRTQHLLNRIDRHAPDVICLTETHHDLLSQRGYSICSRPDSGYGIKKGRRKVVLWSRQPWREVDDLGKDELPPGRFVSGVTPTSVGDVTVVGICIPWFGSRTEAWRGDRRKKPWEDHGRFLDGLPQVLERLPRERVIVIGDFNQIIGPASRAPAKLRRALQEAFLPTGMRIVTSDLTFEGRASIDHIALSADLVATSVSPLSNLREEKKLSDHFGVAAHVSTRGQAPYGSLPLGSRQAPSGGDARLRATSYAVPPRVTGRVDLHELLTDPSRSDTSS